MSVQWRLTGLEFIAASDLAGRDTLPYPLRYLPPRMGSAAFAECKRTAQIRVQGLDPDFFVALRVIANPELRTAFDGVANGVRVRACVAESGGFIANAGQLPGETDVYGGDVVLRLGAC